MTERNRALGQILVSEEALSPRLLSSALEEQRDSGERLGAVLVRRGWTSPEAVHRALARQLSLPFAGAALDPAPDALDLVPPGIAWERRVVPLRVSGRTLRVAVADPLDAATVDDLRFQTGRRIEVVVSTPPLVEAALRSAYGEELTSLVRELPPELTRLETDDRAALERAARAAPVVKLVDRLLDTAVREGASDLHLEPAEDALSVRMRVDGVLRPVLTLPGASQRAVLSRIKVMAEMDISVRMRPQDGGFRLEGPRVHRSVRVSTLPAERGEKAVLRILDPGRVPRGLDELGLAATDLTHLRGILRSGQGVLLAAGPTGSGKSSTLFGALAEIDRDRLNVVTLEDPAEYRLERTTQVQVNPRAGLGFAQALRATLRQDPDVIMVGEIRDRETAEIAMSAAVTGHLVLSTIHTNDAPGAITRLLNMGVPPHLVAAGLAGVVSQRLVRTACPRCRGRGGGCSFCPDGYRGRTGIFQVLIMNDRLRELTVRGANENTLRREARRQGMRTLEEDARRKIAEGQTTPHEVGRVIRSAPGSGAPCAGCGGQVPEAALGCPRCGRRIAAVCSCGEELQPGWRYCPRCLRPAAPALSALEQDL